MNDTNNLGWKIATLFCVILIVAALVVIVALIASKDGEKEKGVISGITDESQSRQNDAASSQAPDKKSSSGGEVGSEEGSKPSDNKKDGNGGGNEAMPIPSSSVEEGLLTMAAMDYLKNTAGTTQGYSIREIKFSKMDPQWARVTFEQQLENFTLVFPVYFYKQAGAGWAPAPSGPGSPAQPTDI